MDEVKQRLDIVDVVSEYVPLQKAGRAYKALCPFHVEKTPSFFVFPERQSWRCFGACATGGDVFSFLMKREGISFGESLRLLAGKAGVALVSRQRDESEEKEIERLYQINEAAARYYHRMLLDSPSAEVAREHLRKRGIAEKTVVDFQIGFSLDSWQALREELTRQGFAEAELVAAGLLIEREQGGSYDRFRNRLMFPVREEKGRIVGFGARALDDSLPKYLNSPQTKIFDKSGVLYGIDRAKEAIRRHNLAVIVEGYIDVLIAHQYNFTHVVASLGTSLTEKQVALLKRLTKNLSLALDADDAGAVATLRGIEIATRSLDQKTVPVPTWRGRINYENILDAEIKVILLPPGKDPDEVIREDFEGWQRLVREALPVIDYTFEAVTSRLDLTQWRDRSSAVEQLLPVVREIRDPVRRAYYLQKLSRLARVDESELVAALKALGFSSDRRKEQRKSPEAPPLPSLSARDPLEEYCLALLFRYPELKSYGAGLLPEYFERSENRELFLVWRDTPQGVPLSQVIAEALQEHLERLEAMSLPPMEEEVWREAFRDCARRLRERWLRHSKLEEEIRVSEALSRGDEAEVERLQEQGLELNIQLREVILQPRRRGTEEGEQKEHGLEGS